MEPSHRASISGPRSLGSAAFPSVPIPTPSEIVVTAEEKDAVLKVLGESNEALVMWRVATSAGISQQRMEGILPILVRDGFVKRLDSADAVRYAATNRRIVLPEEGTAMPPQNVTNSPRSPEATSKPVEAVSKVPGADVTSQERKAVLKALDDIGKPLVMWKLAACSKIAEQRIEEILPALMREGLVKRVDARDAVRYAGTGTLALHSKRQSGKPSQTQERDVGTHRRRTRSGGQIKVPSPPPSRKPVHNPENYCPICGACLRTAMGHVCRASVLASIDGANTRALNDEYSWPDVREHWIGYRLDIGYMLLSDDEIPDEGEER